MTNEQQLRIEILELQDAMAALERIARSQQCVIDELRHQIVELKNELHECWIGK